MALLTIRPSRGTIAFFGLLALTLTVRFGWNKHEQQLFVRDAPPTLTARRLLRCVLGRDAQRLLGPRPLANAAPWEALATDRLRSIVTARERPQDWPSRCVPIAERLVSRMNSTKEWRRAVSHAIETHRLLVTSAADPLEGLTLIEDRALGNALADLAYEASSMSDGAEEGWNSQLASAPTDLDPVPHGDPPRAQALPDDADYAVLALPDVVLYQNARDRRLHRRTFGANEVATDRDVGEGAPVRGFAREGAVLVASDEGDAVFLPSAEPAALLPLPEPIARGDEALGAWQVAFTRSAVWLLNESDGALHVRTTPRAGELHWTDVATPAGFADVLAAGAVLTPENSAGDRVAVLDARRGATGVSFERWTLDTATPPASATPPPATLTANARRGRTSTTPADANTTLLNEWPVFDPHVVTCAAGATRYVLLASDAGMTLVTARDGRASARELRASEWGTPGGGRFELTCTEGAALLFADLAGRAGALIYMDADASMPTAWVPAARASGANGRVVGGALTEHHGLVVLVDNGATLRAYTTHDRGAHWEGGALLAMQRPPTATRPPPDGDDGERRVDVGALAAAGDQVAVLVNVREGPVQFVGRLASRDGGATWVGEPVVR